MLSVSPILLHLNFKTNQDQQLMEQTAIMQELKTNLAEIIPELDSNNIDVNESLLNLGANSIDRADLVIMTLETLKLHIPMSEFAGAMTIRQLAEKIYNKLAAGGS